MLGLVPVIPFVGSLLAIIFGGVARKQIKESEGRQTGIGMATWGIVLGIVAMVGTVVVVIVLVAAAHSANVSYNNGFAAGSSENNQGIQTLLNSSGGNGESAAVYCNQQGSSDPDPVQFYLGCVAGWSSQGS